MRVLSLSDFLREDSATGHLREISSVVNTYLAGGESQEQTLQGHPGLATVWAGKEKRSSLNKSKCSAYLEYPEGLVLLPFQADSTRTVSHYRGTRSQEVAPP